jgi:hypothetical protein
VGDSLGVHFLLVQLLIPIVCAAFEVVTHILIARTLIKRGTIVSTLIAWSLGVLVLLIAEVTMFVGSEIPVSVYLPYVLLNFIFYSSLAFVYFCFFNIGESSVRIRILFELQRSAMGLSPAEMERLYDVNAIIMARLERMLSSGEIHQHGELYFFSGKARMLLIANACQQLKFLILGRKSFSSKNKMSP